jgi:hypothetical protein
VVVVDVDTFVADAFVADAFVVAFVAVAFVAVAFVAVAFVVAAFVVATFFDVAVAFAFVVDVDVDFGFAVGVVVGVAAAAAAAVVFRGFAMGRVLAGRFPSGNDRRPSRQGPRACYTGPMSTDVTASLRALLRNPSAPMAEVSALLDGADGAARRDALFSLSGREQQALYERAAASAPLTLEDLVPKGVPALTPVIHAGKNSLPVFREFEKRMCRPDDGTARVYGYNEGFTRAFIGPGYFVAYPTGLATDLAPGWASRGGVVVDYFQVPQTPVVAGWPRVMPNERGLQRFVFRGMRDYLRKVSRHASIGAAWRGEVNFNSWFVLCRGE